MTKTCVVCPNTVPKGMKNWCSDRCFKLDHPPEPPEPQFDDSHLDDIEFEVDE